MNVEYEASIDKQTTIKDVPNGTVFKLKEDENAAYPSLYLKTQLGSPDSSDNTYINGKEYKKQWSFNIMDNRMYLLPMDTPVIMYNSKIVIGSQK